MGCTSTTVKPEKRIIKQLQVPDGFDMPPPIDREPLYVKGDLTLPPLQDVSKKIVEAKQFVINQTNVNQTQNTLIGEQSINTGLQINNAVVNVNQQQQQQQNPQMYQQQQQNMDPNLQNQQFQNQQQQYQQNNQQNMQYQNQQPAFAQQIQNTQQNTQLLANQETSTQYKPKNSAYSFVKEVPGPRSTLVNQTNITNTQNTVVGKQDINAGVRINNTVVSV